MSQTNIFSRVFRFYVDGFKSMTIGRVLWLIIIIKLIVMFAILKPFFFRPVLNQYDTPQEKATHVGNQLLKGL